MAKEYRVRQKAISSLITKARKNRRFLPELLAQRDETNTRREIVADVVVEMNSLNKYIETSQAVVEQV